MCNRLAGAGAGDRAPFEPGAGLSAIAPAVPGRRRKHPVRRDRPWHTGARGVTFAAGR